MGAIRRFNVKGATVRSQVSPSTKSILLLIKGRHPLLRATQTQSSLPSPSAHLTSYQAIAAVVANRLMSPILAHSSRD